MDAALVGAGDPPLREVEKLVAREHPAWTLAKGVQEVEFGSRHGDFGARGTNQLAQRQMNLPARECDRLSRWMRRGNRLGRAAAQHRPDTGQQFARVERLRQVIVRAHLQPDYAVDLLVLGGQHDYRSGRGEAQTAAQAQTV